MTGERKERRGFASMTPEKQREIASKGGRAAHQKGTAHEWTSEEARSAGRKGGQISRGGRGRLVDDERRRAARADATTRPARPSAIRRAAVAFQEACAYVETGSDGDGRGAGQRGDGICPEFHDGQRQRASRRPSNPAAATTSSARRRHPSGDDDVNGDTGLWFVPTGEVLPAKKWSISAYRVNFDCDQGFTDVSNWPVTFGVRAGDRAEIFGAWTLVRRIDRDVRPLFVPDQPTAGGLVNEYPFVRQGWSDNQLGDLWLGAKVNLTSQWKQKPVAFAVRGMIKLPTAKNDDEGVGTGKTDFAFDAIVSKEVNERVEVSGYGGFIFRGDPDGVDLANGFRWGFGAGVPSRKSLRFTAELHGESYLSDSGDDHRRRCRRRW